MNLDPGTKSIKLTLDSPEKKWNGTSLIKFPKGKYFCFFYQIPECLYHNYFLTQAKEREPQALDFYIIWDSYPYIQEQLIGIGKNLFAPATLKFDGENNGLFRYIVEVEGQMILFIFTQKFNLVKVAWIAQGITLAPPGQEIVDDE